MITDDHSVVRKGIRMLLQDMEGIEILGEASNAEETLKKLEVLKPDVLITDISMPGMSGIELVKEVKKNFPETQVLILSTYFDEEYILESYEVGALGYLPKNSSDEQLFDAVNCIARGDLFHTPEVLNVLGKSLIVKNRPQQSLKSLLTQREKEVLAQLVEGATNKEIANKLFLSTRTIDAHRRNIMSKLDVNNSAQLVKLTLEKRLI